MNDTNDMDNHPVLAAENLSRHYVSRSKFFKWQTIKALNNVSFTVLKARTLAVVGESGCGKSTLARQLTLIEKPTSGTVKIAGKKAASRQDIKQLRRHVQMVFQNPLASLNPRKTVAQTLCEPLKINTHLSMPERKDRVFAALHNVGLLAEHANRYPHMFSGGQRQRVAIARAMILEPKLVVADEPVSALDVSIQAQILNLFMDLQEKFGISYVFISHNLAVVERIADDVMVMYLGRIVEIGEKKKIFEQPLHPYTQVLMSATPALYAKQRRARIIVNGEPPSPLDPPPGCTFHRRCPYAIERCRVEEPILREVAKRWVRCHRVEEIAN